MTKSDNKQKEAGWLVLLGLLIFVPLMLAIGTAKEEMNIQGLDKKNENGKLTPQN